MAKAKKTKYRDLSVNSFDLNELTQGVREKKNNKKQEELDEKVKRIEQDFKINSDDKNK